MRSMRGMKHTPTAARLVKKLRTAGVVLPLDDKKYGVFTVTAGRHQRSMGAWSWCLVEDVEGGWQEMRPSVGSQYTVREIMRTPHIDRSVLQGEIHIDPRQLP